MAQSGGTTGGDAGSTGSTGGPAAAEAKEASAAPADRSMDTSASQRGLGVNCAGLSDRQSERACRDGHSVGHNQSPSGWEDGGKTDDQAS